MRALGFEGEMEIMDFLYLFTDQVEVMTLFIITV